MERPTFQTPEWNDIVFENRNKDYGAYVLRMEHERNTAYGIYSVFGLMIGITLFAILYSVFKPVPFVDPLDPTVLQLKFTNNIEIMVDKPEVEAAPPKTTVKQVNSEQFNNIQIVQQTDNTIATQEDLAKTTASSVTVNDGTNGTEVLPAGNGAGAGPAIEAPEVETPMLSELVQIKPVFPGGDEALNRYLARNIHYTNGARVAGVQGNIFVNFVIGEDGKPQDVQIARGLGFGLDQIAQEVIKNMPAWSPGMMGERAVKVRYSLRLVFRLN